MSETNSRYEDKRFTDSDYDLEASVEGVNTGGVETTTGPIQGRPRRTLEGRLTLLDIERPGNPDVFSAALREDALAIVARYPAGQSRSALLPMLHLVQSEQGYVTPDGIAFCADVLGHHQGPGRGRGHVLHDVQAQADR